MRVGVIGAGSLGFHHIRILRDMESVTLSGFAESNDERAAHVASELGVRRYDDEAGLLADVDAVTIVVPTTAHYEVAKSAIEAGKHVFIEKPITTTLAEAEELIELATKKGVLVQIGHVERFNKAVRAALPYVSRPRFIESERLATFNLRGSDVAVVLDLMIHDIDLVLTLVQDTAEEISAVGVPILTPMLDIANARVTFSSGAVANITSSRISRDRVRKIRIFQESGYMSLDLAAGTGNFFRLKEKLDPSKPPQQQVSILDFVEYIPLTAPEGEPLRLEFDAFVAAIQGEAPVIVSGEDGKRALAVALRIVQEIERTRPAFTTGVAALGGA
jgi:predicted dehydrogenase